MNNNIQCSIESSTTKIELNSAVDGVFLVPELEGLVGLPEIRTTSGVNAGYDGGWTSAQNYDARLISIRGVIANPDISKVEDKRRAIASLLGQGRKEQLTLRFTTEAGNAYAISVRTISCEMALQRVLTTQEFLIQLRADDPLIYDDGTTGGIAAILQPQRALGGFEINFELPLVIGGGAEDTVVDNGNETVYPVIKLYGALHSPTVVNRTTNQQMQILADLQYSIDWHTYRSATGDYILVSDGLNGAPMTLSQLTGNAEQTTYSGKNLLNINATPTLGHTTVSVSGQSITVTSDAQAITARAEIPFTYEAGRQMTISFDATCLTYEPTATNTSIVYLRSGSNNAGYKSIGHTVGTTTHYTTTFTPTVAGMSLWLYIKSSNVAGVVSFRFDNIQIEYGASETEYEQFVGGIPAPNPDYPQSISTVTGGQTVVVTGKNLLDTSDPHDKAGSGMTATWNNGVVEVKGTNTATSFPLSDNIALPTQIKAGTEISASFAGASVGNTVFRFFNQATNQYEALAVTNPNTSSTYTLTRDADAVQLYKGGVPTNTYKEFSISNWQIEYGSTATAFEPYQGQSHEVNLGKNLFSVAFDSGGSTPASDTNAFTLTKPSTRTKMFNFPTTLAAGTYTISFNITSDTTSQSSATGGIRFQLINSSGTVISGTGAVAIGTGAKSRTWTVSESVHAIYFYINNGEADNVSVAMTDVMLERGSRATTYAPYFDPIELAKIGTYQDRIYKDDGKWYIEKQVGKVVLNGTEDWKIAVTGTANFYYNLQNMGLSFVNNNYTISNLAINAAPAISNSNTNQGMTFYPSVAGGQLRIRYGTEMSIPDWKALLAATNMYYYYALATPTTTEITDEALLYQLNFLASLYKGENNISLVGTGAQGEMEVFIRDVMSVETDVVPEVPVRLTLTDDGVINACGCRRNVQLTMRETTE